MRDFKGLPAPVKLEFGRLADKHGLLTRSNRVINTTTPGMDAVEYTFYHNKERTGRIALSWDPRGHVTARIVSIEPGRGNGNSKDKEERRETRTNNPQVESQS